MTDKQEHSLLDTNLSNARSENESYEDYRNRLRINKEVIKTYFTVGREAFREIYPNGVGDAIRSALTPEPQPETQTTDQPADGAIEYRLNNE